MQKLNTQKQHKNYSNRSLDILTRKTNWCLNTP